MKHKFSLRCMFDTRKEYIAHLLLILATLFVAYPLGNWILGFQEGLMFWRIVKMFLFFAPVLYLADNVWEYILRV